MYSSRINLKLLKYIFYMCKMFSSLRLKLMEAITFCNLHSYLCKKEKKSQLLLDHENIIIYLKF